MNISKGTIKKAQKVVVYGPEGIGKSTISSKFPDPLYSDTEGSTFMLDVARMDKPSSWTMLIAQADYVRKTPGICKTYVIDTADWAETLCINHIIARGKVSSIEDYGYGKGYTMLEEEFGKLLNILQDIVDSGINVVLTAHAWMRKFEQPDELGAYDRWELKLEKKTAALVKEWADLLLFANYKTMVINVDGQGATKGKNKAQGGQRVMYATHAPTWDAKNRHGLPDEMPFDFSSIAHLFGSPTSVSATPQAKPVETPPPVKQPEPILTQEVIKETAPIAPVVENVLLGIDDSIPKALRDLMEVNKVTAQEIQEVVSKRGYYPENTPIKNYDPNFIAGVLIGAWDQVYGMIKANKDKYEIAF